MSKKLGYFCLVVIAIAILGTDFLVLTSSAALSRIAQQEINALMGQNLEYRDLTARWDQSLVLRSVALYATAKRLRVLSADRVEVQLRRRAGAYVPEAITLVDARVTFNDAFFTEISHEPARRPLRELYPPDALPRIHCSGGQLEIIHQKILHWSAPQTLAIEDLSLVPVSGYRYFVGGRLRSALLGAWRVSGEFDLDSGATHLSLSSDAVMAGPELRAILSPSIHTDWDRYTPEGLARVRIQVDADPGEPTKFRATVAPIRMKLCYAGFPYAVEDIEGELDFLADGFVIKHLSARSGNTRIRFDGRAGGYATESDFAFRIEIDSMPMDEKLRAALEPAARKLYDQFGPSGVLDARGLVLREYGLNKPVRNPLDIRFREASFRFVRFPYEMTKVEGELHLESPFARVLRMRGQHGTGTFEASGVLDALDGDPVIDLRIRGENVTLDAALKHALPDDALKTWDRFSPSGTVDIQWHVTKKKGESERHTGEATARSCRATYKDVPLPASDITGHISYKPEEVQLSHLEGTLDAGKISVSGTAAQTDKGWWRHAYDIAAVGARVDDRFTKAMPKAIADMIDTLKLSGVVDFQLHFDMEGEGASEKMGWIARIKLHHGAIKAAVAIEDIEGTVDFVGWMREGTTVGTGPMRFDSCRVVGKKITDLSASLTVENEKVSISNIRGTAYSGIVTGSLIIYSDTTNLNGDFRVDRLELREFIRDTEGYANRVLAGKVNIEVADLAGKGNDPATLTGRGSMTITNGQLFEIPLLANMLSPFSSNKRFDAGKMVFTIENRKFQIASFGFESESGGSVVGKGYLTFDGYYNVRIKVNPAPILGIKFFLFEIIPAIFGQFLGTRMTGYLEGQPDVTQVKPGEDEKEKEKDKEKR